MLKLAQAIVIAAKAHEESWNGHKYVYSIQDCARWASDDADIQWLAEMMLLSYWNDALDWANGKLTAEHGPHA